MKFISAVALLCLVPFAASRRVKASAKKLSVEAKTSDTMASAPRCSTGISEPAGGDTIQSHFDSKRKEMSILQQNTTSCTKRDVCLLMRQLDMDFYKRARAGKLVDADYSIPPEETWLHAGSCRDHNRGEGKRYAPITERKACIAALKKTVWKGLRRSQRKLKVVSSNRYPAGCSVETNNLKKRNQRGRITVRFNTNANSPKEAGRYTEDGKSRFFRGKDVSTIQLCVHDRSLSPAAAAYYSPYKLKQSMVHRTKMSTTCSFGMYAHLARQQETKSSCANILTQRTSRKYYSAQDALDKAARLQRRGQKREADDIRDYVETVRQKYVLMDVIANDWCPGVWNEALASSQTCSVERIQEASAEDDATLQNLFDHPRDPKIAFEDDFCKNVRDESLADRLKGVPEAPPDFFRNAKIGD